MTSSFFSRFKKPVSSETSPPVIVVSGLPRSGTSMMMKMLEAGGMPLLTDHIRTADDSNPKGYFEYERVKKLKDGDVEWVQTAPGKAVKVISYLLEYLPSAYTYQVVFMRRDMAEILASQKQMLSQRGEADGSVSDENMSELFFKHLERVQSWLSRQENFKVIYISYNEVLQSPMENIIKVHEFLGGKLNLSAMGDVMDKALYRQRSQNDNREDQVPAL